MLYLISDRVRILVEQMGYRIAVLLWGNSLSMKSTHCLVYRSQYIAPVLQEGRYGDQSVF